MSKDVILYIIQGGLNLFVIVEVLGVLTFVSGLVCIPFFYTAIVVLFQLLYFHALLISKPPYINNELAVDH